MKKIINLFLNWIYKKRGYPINDCEVISIIKKMLEKFGHQDLEVKPSDIVTYIAKRFFDEECVVFSFYHDHLYYLVYMSGETSVISEDTARNLLHVCLLREHRYLIVDFSTMLIIKYYRNGHFKAYLRKIK